MNATSQAWNSNQPVDFTKHHRADGQPEEEDAHQDLEDRPDIGPKRWSYPEVSIWLP